MSTKTEKTETKVALREGWFGNQRQRIGDTFQAPVSLKGKWFRSASDKSELVQDALGTKTNILAVEPKNAGHWAASATSAEINEAISVEQGASSPRKAVLKQLRDELANRVGRTGGPDPAAKQLEEKDPLTGPGADLPAEDEVLK